MASDKTAIVFDDDHAIVGDDLDAAADQLAWY